MLLPITIIRRMFSEKNNNKKKIITSNVVDSKYLSHAKQL